ncbi:hypothetical protein C8J36_101273 [Rhizobium sp. PP-F2F-G48]|nr:hypothetical protein C8J36_101273 [Rhizobium sp. PP-F2F-G48]
MFHQRPARFGVGPEVTRTLPDHRNLAATQRYIDVRDDMMKAAVELTILSCAFEDSVCTDHV